jgi:oligopeptide/dipeptide ABC transporter ATP-binding protein
MYAGSVLEEGPVERLFAHPAHPYTQMLLRATPRAHGAGELLSFPARFPSPSGCRRAAASPIAVPTGSSVARASLSPAVREAGHTARCWLLAGSPAAAPATAAS